MLSYDVFRETESTEAGMDQLKLASKSPSSPHLPQLAPQGVKNVEMFSCEAWVFNSADGMCVCVCVYNVYIY